MEQLGRLWNKLKGSRKAQIAIVAVLLIVLCVVSTIAGCIAITLLVGFGMWHGLHKLITRKGKHRALDIAMSAV